MKTAALEQRDLNQIFRLGVPVDLSKENLAGMVIEDAVTVMADFSQTVCSRVQFRKCKFRSADFQDSNLSNAVMTESSFSSCDFSGSIISDLSAKGVDFTGSIFRSTFVTGCDFNGARLNSVTLTGKFSSCDMEYAKFRNAQAEEFKFQDCKLLYATFDGSNLHKAKFIGCDLIRADLNECDLRGAVFTDSNLLGTHFKGSDIRGADFSTCDLSRVNIQGAIWDDTTSWPMNFKPPSKTARLLSDLRSIQTDLQKLTGRK